MGLGKMVVLKDIDRVGRIFLEKSITHTYLVLAVGLIRLSSCAVVEDLFAKYNLELKEFQQVEAKLAWNISLGYGVTAAWDETTKICAAKSRWNKGWCRALSSHLQSGGLQGDELHGVDSRRLNTVCSSSGFSEDESRRIGKLLQEMQSKYNSKRIFGMKVEPDLTDFMGRMRNAEQLEQVWVKWNKEIGTELKPLYIQLVQELNAGVEKEGFSSMAAVWQDEMGMSDVKGVGKGLYEEIRPLYTLLHAYVRYKLGEFYKISINASIPVHLLGNMWGQKWDGLMDILMPPDGDETKGNADYMRPGSMMNSVEKLYVSMGLPGLPESVRENSRLFLQGGQHEEQSCHGTAINMFQGNSSGRGDYRILMCAPGKLGEDELVTLVHEMGHVYYFMAASSQEPIFQGGALPAFHEAVGDSISYGYYEMKSRGKGEGEVMKRLLKIGLAKIPQIVYGLILDTWRWEVFESRSPEKWNALWWKLNEELMGISHPGGYRTRGFDPLGKYHVVQNMPYLRYFFASFLQLQFFESYCRGQDIHSCKLYGNTEAGARLWNMMKKGASVDWRDALEEMTGYREISAKPLMKYFKPLQSWLEKEIKELNIPVGW